MMQKFKRNWLVRSKLTWGIWQILTRSLKNLEHLHFNQIPLSKAYNVWAKKSIGDLFLMVLNIDATFGGKLTCPFKNDMRNLSNFHQSVFGSLTIYTAMGYFYPKQKMYELKIYRAVLCHKNEEWYQVWREIGLPVQNWREEFDEVSPEYSKISKIWTLMGFFFWKKNIMFELKKV